MNKREMMKVSKTLQSQTQENDKRILDAASNLRDGALGRYIQRVCFMVHGVATHFIKNSAICILIFAFITK